MHRITSIRLLVTAVLAVVLAVGGLTTGPATAADDGGIRGRVVSTAHPGGLAGVTVRAWSTWPPLPVLTTTTGPDGTYDLSPLPAGPYYVELADPAKVHRDVFLGDTDRLDDATQVQVGSGTVTAPDARLVAFGHVTGRVTGPDGVGVAQASVVGYPVSQDGMAGVMSGAMTAADAQGRYDLGGLLPGVYQMYFQDPTPNRYRAEFWDDEFTKDRGTTFRVDEGAVVTRIDGRLARPVQIDGAVTDVPGVTSSYVEAHRWHPGRRAWELITTHELLSGRGSFTLAGLPAGTYRIGVDYTSRKDDRRVHTKRFWGGAARLADATDVVLSPGQSRSGIRVDLSGITATTLPRLRGRAAAGATLRVTRGTWAPRRVTVRYRWFAGGKPVAGARSSALRITGSVRRQVARKVISVRVTASAPGLPSVTRTLRAPGLVRR